MNSCSGSYKICYKYTYAYCTIINYIIVIIIIANYLNA